MAERAAACMLVALTAAGCRPAAPGDPLPAADACIVVDGTARSRITLGVAGGAPPLPLAAGGIAAAQVYDTLVRVDCTGTVVAGLADAWSSDDRVTWRFRVADDVTFSDGTAVTAQSIVESWATVHHSRFAAVHASGSTELHVTLHTAADARVFALPELAVARPAGAGAGAASWPAGTGNYRPDSTAERVLRLLARTANPVTADTIEIRAFGGDPRTALDAGVDAFVTADAAALAYARVLPGYRIKALTWSRVHVLATTTHAADVTPPTAEDVAGLAHDVVSGDARSALPPFWWEGCDRPMLAPARSRTSGRVVYEQGDETGRRLAERVTALAWPREDAPPWLRDVLGRYESPPVSRALSRAELIDAARTRADLAIVSHLPRMMYDGCASVSADPQALSLPSFSGWRITPLVDTREHLIHRPDIGRVRVDADGRIRFEAG